MTSSPMNFTQRCGGGERVTEPNKQWVLLLKSSYLSKLKNARDAGRRAAIAAMKRTPKAKRVVKVVRRKAAKKR